MSDWTRKNTEMAHRRQRVAEMYLRGSYQSEIADSLGVDQTTISRDLLELRKEWQVSALVNINEAKAKELAKIDTLEMEYWRAWERSKLDAEIEVTEQVGSRKKPKPGDPPGEPAIIPEKIKKYKRVEGQSGNPAFLAGVQWCINKRCEILGLNAAQRNQNLNVDLSRLTDEQLTRLANGEDLYHVLTTSS